MLGGRAVDVRVDRIGGVPYLRFVMEQPDDHDLDEIASMSASWALFSVETSGALQPIELPRFGSFDDDLLTILKYPGKTNEQLTRLLVNITRAAATNVAADRRPLLFDPLCGRGTTIGQALMDGFDAVGVDNDVKDVQAYGQFLETWAKTKRLKHQLDRGQVRRDGKVLGQRIAMRVAPTKDSFKAGDSRTVTLFAGDTTDAGEVVRKGSVDLLVADLPYGVQHGSKAAGTGRGSLERSPVALLERALPTWLPLLHPGAAIGFAWNTHVVSRADLMACMQGFDLNVIDDELHRRFEHRVDASIQRDLVVARFS